MNCKKKKQVDPRNQQKEEAGSRNWTGDLWITSSNFWGL